MNNKQYLNELKMIGIPLKESIPFTEGTVSIEKGRTSVDGHKQPCLILNKLEFITFLPNFMFIIPDIEVLYKNGGATNGFIVCSLKAQQLEYTTEQKGTCNAVSYFFGREKPGRIIDVIQRVFERGFSIDDIKGIKGFNPKAKIDISVKYTDYMKASTIKGDEKVMLPKVAARFRTTFQ